MAGSPSPQFLPDPRAALCEDYLDFGTDSAPFMRGFSPPPTHVAFQSNDLGMLARYNRRVVEQCYKHVYCSVKTDLVLSAFGN